ncbi:hypothetical protein OURE66S_02699 [Oligella ureolytica]
MLKIPSTSPMQYISSIVALNIHSPEGTGDWHSASSLSENAFPLDLYFYGDEQKKQYKFFTWQRCQPHLSHFSHN